jgi:hypothetical protein
MIDAAAELIGALFDLIATFLEGLLHRDEKDER